MNIVFDASRMEAQLLDFESLLEAKFPRACFKNRFGLTIVTYV